MFDLLKKAASVTVDVATLPVSLAVDAVTLGGTLNDREEPYTVTKAKRIAEDAGEVIDEIAS